MTKITIANLYDDLQTSLQSLRDDPGAVRRSREIVERALRDGQAYYGINTGFGALRGSGCRRTSFGNCNATCC